LSIIGFDRVTRGSGRMRWHLLDAVRSWPLGPTVRARASSLVHHRSRAPCL